MCQNLSKTNFAFGEKKIQEIPMVDIAYEIFKQSKDNYTFKNLVKEIAVVRRCTVEDLKDHLNQLYTELNIDGRFIHLGKNEWGLKSWFSIDQVEQLLINRDDKDDENDAVAPDNDNEETSAGDNLEDDSIDEDDKDDEDDDQKDDQKDEY